MTLQTGLLYEHAKITFLKRQLIVTFIVDFTYVTSSPLKDVLEPANFTLFLELSNETFGNISESQMNRDGKLFNLR